MESSENFKESNGFHMTYNDYLIHMTKQNKSLRNPITDPNLNLRQNLPLFINYQISDLRRKHSNNSVDMDTVHNKISNKIEKIQDMRKVEERRPQAMAMQGVAEDHQGKDKFVQSLYRKIFAKNQNVNKIDRHFTFESPASLPRKIEKKEKESIDKSLRLLMHDNISEQFLSNIFRKFCSLQLKRSILDEKISRKKGDDPSSWDFETRFEALYKKPRNTVDNQEYMRTVKELCKIKKINMANLLDLPEAIITHEFIKRYSSILRNKDLTLLQEKEKDNNKEKDSAQPKKKKKKARQVKNFQSEYFTKLLNEPEFSFGVDDFLNGKQNKKTLSLDLQSLMPFGTPNSARPHLVMSTKRSCPRSNSNDYSSRCIKHGINRDTPLGTERTEFSEGIEKIKSFYDNCQEEANLFNRIKGKFERKIVRTQKKADQAFGKLYSKEKLKNVGMSNNFRDFINQREFKRKLIKNLISQSSEAEKNYVMISYKQKQK